MVVENSVERQQQHKLNSRNRDSSGVSCGGQWTVKGHVIASNNESIAKATWLRLRSWTYRPDNAIFSDCPASGAEGARRIGGRENGVARNRVPHVAETIVSNVRFPYRAPASPLPSFHLHKRYSSTHVHVQSRQEALVGQIQSGEESKDGHLAEGMKAERGEGERGKKEMEKTKPRDAPARYHGI